MECAKRYFDAEVGGSRRILGPKAKRFAESAELSCDPCACDMLIGRTDPSKLLGFLAAHMRAVVVMQYMFDS